MENSQELTQSQAVNVLIQAVRIAQAKGAFTLEDAELVAKAIRIFVPANQTENGADPIMNQEPQSDEALVQPIVEKV
jgi:hypothetical protein